MKEITQDLLKSIFNYNPDSGSLTWKIMEDDKSKAKGVVATRNTRYAGTEVGYNRKDGYKGVRVLGKSVLVHRMVFLLHYGHLPNFIDHINGNRSDNSALNLRETTKAQNAQNMKLLKSNKSGIKGVSWRKQSGKWVAQISKDNKKIYIGLFDDINEAKVAIDKARSELHGKFANYGEGLHS